MKQKRELYKLQEHQTKKSKLNSFQKSIFALPDTPRRLIKKKIIEDFIPLKLFKNQRIGYNFQASLPSINDPPSSDKSTLIYFPYTLILYP